MSKFKVIIKLATKVGPALVAVAMRYGPQIRQILKDNPQAFDRIIAQTSKISKLREKKKSTDAFARRCAVLREQVTYLYASANTAEVAQQAQRWRHELENMERSLPLLEVMSRKNRMNEMRKIDRKIDYLSTSILAASLVDDIEDA